MIKEFQGRVDAATDLENLVSVLEEIAEEIAESDLKIDEVVDLAMLPTFGGSDVKNTKEVWSWDEKNILAADGSRWSIEPRCKCGEASFHCKCGEAENEK